MEFRSITIPLLGLALTITPAFAAQMARMGEPGPAQPAQLGTVNYVEGSVSINGQPVSRNQVGSASLEAGEELTTATGKAEILLTPGVFLRVDDNSTVKMVSPDLVNTQVMIVKGRAGVEVDEIHKDNDLQVLVGSVATRLEKTGYYEFDASRPEVMVFKGKADVELADGKTKDVKGDHEAALAAGSTNVKTTDIDENRDNDDLYKWSRLRSEYLAEANNEMAGDYEGAAYAPGWYWDPYGWGYTYIGADPFYSPFGWGYYPLGWYGGWYGGYYGRGYYGRGGYRRFDGRGTERGYAAHSGGANGSHGGGSMSGGMGGGGFHGGGMGGGGAHR